MKLKENSSKSLPETLVSIAGKIRAVFGKSVDRLPTSEEVGGNPRAVPVLTVTDSFRLWNKVKWPLFFGSVVLVVLLISAIVYYFVAENEIDEVLALVRFNEYVGEMERLDEAEKRLSDLYKEYPDWERVNSAYAWQLFYRSELFGPREDLQNKAREMISKGNTGDDEEGLLVQGMSQYLAGKYDACVQTASEGMREYPESSRFAFLRVLAMSQSVETKKTLEIAKEAHSKHPEYVPLVLFAVKTASERGTKSQSLRWTRKLVSISPNHVYGSLFLIEARLPPWGSQVLNAEKFEALREEARFLKSKHKSRSPVVDQLVRYLQGRFAYHRGNAEKAREVLGQLVATNPAAKYLAWYGQSIYQVEGPDAVLKALTPYKNVHSQELALLRATCLLAHYRVSQAERVLQKMRTAVDYRPNRAVRRAEWLLATKKGDLEKAVQLLPEIIRAPYQWTALELYWQLKDVGDEAGVQKVIASLDKTFSACSKTMDAWQSRRSKKVMRIHTSPRNSDNACVQAISAHSLRSYLPVEELEKASDLAASTAKSENAWIEVDRALIQWMMHGQAAALKILDGLLAREPEGKPLIYHLARAFLEMDLPKRAQDLANPCDTPEGIDICIRAAEELDQTQKVKEWTRKAVAMAGNRQHPALYPYQIQSILKRQPSSENLNEARRLTKISGAWSVFSTKHYVEALERLGEFDAIDLSFQRIPHSISPTAGLDIAWKIKEFGMQFHLNRGKRYLKRAARIIGELEDVNVRSAHLFYGLGILKLVRNSSKNATKWFEQALVYEPSFLLAGKRLAKLGKLSTEMKDRLVACYPQSNLKSLR